MSYLKWGFAFSLFLALSACMGGGGSKKEAAPSEPMMCTMDVKKCSDGSFVSRDPSKGCAFKACP